MFARRGSESDPFANLFSRRASRAGIPGSGRRVSKASITQIAEHEYVPDTFSDFVKAQCFEDESLVHLAYFLTGEIVNSDFAFRMNPNRTVNVKVCDISCDDPDKPHCEIRSISDIESLQQWCANNAEPNVKLRLFLVEDMTPPVVEVLGKAYKCHPQLFAEHMSSIGKRPLVDIEGIEEAGATGEYSISTSTIPVLKSRFKHRPFFSLPFARPYVYATEQAHLDHERRRTMFRYYDPEDQVLEERVSGVVYKLPEYDYTVGILLFDSIGKGEWNLSEAITKSDVLRRPPRFGTMTDPNMCANGERSPEFNSLRYALLRQLEKREYLRCLVEDSTILLWSVIGRMVLEWQIFMIACEWETGLADNIGQDATKDNDVLWEYTRKLRHCAANLSMMKAVFDVIDSGGTESWSCSPHTRSAIAMTDVKTDVVDQIDRMEKCASGYRQQIGTLASIRSIRESEKQIQQADMVGGLTFLATVYIPLSFVASILGMNVTAISASTTPLWLYFAIAVPLTVVSLAAVSQKDRLMRWYHILEKRTQRPPRQQRPKQKNDDKIV